MPEFLAASGRATKVELLVSLRVEKGMLGDLRAERPPILPDQKAAIELARGRVAETGTFSGFLPGGEYTLAGQRFEVRPGAHALELSLTQTE